nr:unnamed protein product [Digitaria exilis]
MAPLPEKKEATRGSAHQINIYPVSRDPFEPTKLDQWAVGVWRTGGTTLYVQRAFGKSNCLFGSWAALRLLLRPESMVEAGWSSTNGIDCAPSDGKCCIYATSFSSWIDRPARKIDPTQVRLGSSSKRQRGAPRGQRHAPASVRWLGCEPVVQELDILGSLWIFPFRLSLDLSSIPVPQPPAPLDLRRQISSRCAVASTLSRGLPAAYSSTLSRALPGPYSQPIGAGASLHGRLEMAASSKPPRRRPGEALRREVLPAREPKEWCCVTRLPDRWGPPVRRPSGTPRRPVLAIIGGCKAETGSGPRRKKKLHVGPRSCGVVGVYRKNRLPIVHFRAVAPLASSSLSSPQQRKAGRRRRKRAEEANCGEIEQTEKGNRTNRDEIKRNRTNRKRSKSNVNPSGRGEDGAKQAEKGNRTNRSKISAADEEANRRKLAKGKKGNALPVSDETFHRRRRRRGGESEDTDRGNRRCPTKISVAGRGKKERSQIESKNK